MLLCPPHLRAIALSLPFLFLILPSSSLVMSMQGPISGGPSPPSPPSPSPLPGKVDCGVIVVGGGPAGLACALTLAKRGYKDIHVLERNPSAAYFEQDKAYLYRIDGRGQRLTDMLDITPKLADVGVTTDEFLNITIVNPDKSVKTVKAPVDPNQKTAYWLPRRLLLEFFVNQITQRYNSQIHIHYNTTTLGLTITEGPTEGEAQPSITVETTTTRLDSPEPHQVSYCSDRVVGCDGMNSAVRGSLHSLARDKMGDPSKFLMQTVASDSAGLRYKILSLKDGFPVTNTLPNNITHRAQCYSYVGVKPGWFKPPLRLGCLPVKVANMPRTANIIALPDNKIFHLNTAQAVLDYLGQQFPQCDLPSMVGVEQAEAFARSKGGFFPKPQYCTHFQQTVGDGKGGVLLIGDAIHSFPPDLGAGVNSAFLDVYALNSALDQCRDNWAEACQLYEKTQLPQAKAICKLIPVGFPYQYSHMPIKKNVKLFSILLRNLASKLLPSIIAPPVFFMIQDCRLGYLDVFNRATRTTRILRTLALILATIFTVLMFR